MLKAYHKLKTKPKTIVELKEVFLYLRQPATRADQQGCERLLKLKLKTLLEFGAGGGHFEHSQ